MKLRTDKIKWVTGLSCLRIVIVFLCSICTVQADDGSYQWDSNKVVKAKEIFAFEEHEHKAPRYSRVVTNWNPVFTKCDGVTNYLFVGKSDETQDYRGLDGQRWIAITIECFKSSRAAHEHMIKLLSDPQRGKPNTDQEVTDPKSRIGFRCFRGTVGDAYDQIIFIRNNFRIKLFGKGVKVETLARDLDRQILELSEDRAKEEKSKEVKP